MLKGCPPLSIYLLHLETHFGDILNNPSSIPTFFISLQLVTRSEKTKP